MTGTLIVPIVDEGLGNSAYLVPGARNIELGSLPGRAPAVTGRPAVLMCGHGERATTAASVLERAGHPAVAVLTGGPPDWAEATGGRLE